MSIQVNVLEAKTQLSRLLDRAEAGEDIIIARAGHPVARLVPVATRQPTAPRALGVLVGKGWIAEDFDAPLDEDFLLTPGADLPVRRS
jgi:prevent-host-death family protein